MRSIDVTVNGQFVHLGSKSAGVQGESNAASLHITVSRDWEGLSKRIVWRDAEGENPVAVLLYPTAVGDDPLTYDTNIPGEPLGKPGWCSFTIEGYRSPGQIAFTAAAHMEVLPNDQYYRPAEPTPTEAQQIESLLSDTLAQTKDIIEGSAANMAFWAAWDEDHLYDVSNKVYWRGSSYICKTPNAGVNPELDVAGGTEGDCWMLIAKKGDMGEQGPMGGTDVSGISIVPNIQVGTVTTLPPGRQATVERDPNSPDSAPVFNFGIPGGISGRTPRYFLFGLSDWAGGEPPYRLTLPLGWDIGAPTFFKKAGGAAYETGLWVTQCVKVVIENGNAALSSFEKFEGMAIFT